MLCYMVTEKLVIQMCDRGTERLNDKWPQDKQYTPSPSEWGYKKCQRLEQLNWVMSSDLKQLKIIYISYMSMKKKGYGVNVLFQVDSIKGWNVVSFTFTPFPFSLIYDIIFHWKRMNRIILKYHKINKYREKFLEWHYPCFIHIFNISRSE